MKILGLKTMFLFFFNVFFIYFFVQKGFLNSSGIFVEDNFNLFSIYFMKFVFSLLVFNLILVAILSMIKYILEFLKFDNFAKKLITGMLYSLLLIIGTIVFLKKIPNGGDNKLITKNYLTKEFDIKADNFIFNSYINNVSVFGLFDNTNNLAGFNIKGKYVNIKNITTDMGKYDIFIKKLNINNKVVYNRKNILKNINKIYENKLSFDFKQVKIVIPSDKIEGNLISMLYIYTKYIPLTLKGKGNLIYLKNINKFILSNLEINNNFLDLKNATIFILNKNNLNLLKGKIILHFNKDNLSKLYNLYQNFYNNFGSKININILKINKKEKLNYDEFVQYLYTCLVELNNNKNISINLEEIKNNFSILLSGKDIKFDIKISIKR